MKILIFGASGSGTTTLGNQIAQKTDFIHLDVDAYYWKQTNPPFQEKIPLLERNENLRNDFNKYKNVVVTGSLVSWGKEWESAFDLAVFILLDNTIRMERLKKREIERYGNQLQTNQEIKKTSEAFLEWANQYENPNFDGRSLKIHINWIESLTCKVLKLNGKNSLDNNLEIILSEIKL
jgi:adenylate kinase family enzyme